MFRVTRVARDGAVPPRVAIFLDDTVQQLVQDPNAVEIWVAVLFPLAGSGIEKPPDVPIQEVLALVEIQREPSFFLLELFNEAQLPHPHTADF